VIPPSHFAAVFKVSMRQETYRQPTQHSILYGSLLDSSSTISSAAEPFSGGNATIVCHSGLGFQGLQLTECHSCTDLLHAALETGTALATIIIFFALSYQGIKLVWGGNTVGADTYDAKSVPYLRVSTGQHFGKSVGEF
jgi:hypothetical protein